MLFQQITNLKEEEEEEKDPMIEMLQDIPECWAWLKKLLLAKMTKMEEENRRNRGLCF